MAISDNVIRRGHFAQLSISRLSLFQRGESVFVLPPGWVGLLPYGNGHGCSTGMGLLKHAGICQAALAEFHTAGKTAVEMDMLPLTIDFVQTDFSQPRRHLRYGD